MGPTPWNQPHVTSSSQDQPSWDQPHRTSLGLVPTGAGPNWSWSHGCGQKKNIFAYNFLNNGPILINFISFESSWSLLSDGGMQSHVLPQAGPVLGPVSRGQSRGARSQSRSQGRTRSRSRGGLSRTSHLRGTYTTNFFWNDGKWQLSETKDVWNITSRTCPNVTARSTQAIQA